MEYTPTTGGRACAALLVLLVLVAACGAPRTRRRAETPPSVDMSGYQTYRWWRPPLNQGTRGYADDEERLDAAVRLLVERELSARGYRGDQTGRPDFVMRYGVALYDAATQTFRDYLSYPDGGGKDMGAGRGAPMGTFTLEAIDGVTRRTAWRETAPAVFAEGFSENPVRPAVDQMMESFPHHRP